MFFLNDSKPFVRKAQLSGPSQLGVFAPRARMQAPFNASDNAKCVASLTLEIGMSALNPSSTPGPKSIVSESPLPLLRALLEAAGRADTRQRDQWKDSQWRRIVDSGLHLRILMTFTGFHDPYSKGLVEGQDQPGPVLTLARTVAFDRIFLIGTPNTVRNTNETRDALRAEHPAIRIDIEDADLPDPTDYAAIFAALRRTTQRILDLEPEGEYFVAVASGTPQMHAVWLLMIASGELSARILHIRPPKYVTSELPLVSEIDVHNSPFPRVHPYPQSTMEVETSVDCFAAARAIGIVGDHPQLRKTIERVCLLAPTTYPVLILGETGTGKESLARLVHRLSGRPAEKFITLDCGTIPRDLVESTLFGHRKGAFTGATETRPGKFDAANGGTLFLDELGELPIELQPKLLRVLQTGQIEAVGETHPRKVDVRIIAATNVDLEDAVHSHRFREDLYFRLKVGVCRLPPLRARRSDIAKIALHALDRVNTTVGRPKRFTADALGWLEQQKWRGNVRELVNTIEAVAVLTRGESIRIDDLQNVGELHTGPALPLPEPEEGFSLREYLIDTREKLIARALELCAGNQNQASRLLGITPQAISKAKRSTLSKRAASRNEAGGTTGP